MMSPEQTVLSAMLICLGGALLAGLLGRYRTLVSWIAFAVVATSSVLVLLGAGQVLLSGPGHATTFLALPKLQFALRIYVDGLSAFFLGIIAVISLPAAFYSIDYLRQHAKDGAGRYYSNLLVFIAAMYGLVTTTDMMWFFFIFWQMMTLTGWALIRFERGKPEHAQAARRFLLMMQLACAVTMLGAGILARSGVTTSTGEVLMRFDFDAVAHHLPSLLKYHSGWVMFAFFLFLIGFGIKMGMWPFGQIWLPDAHPAAPSPVSALLSGVMIKTGVYGLMRYFLWLVPAEANADYPVAAWGVLIAILGTVTLFIGTVQALKQEQSKRLLAFSSIGQGGYILLGLGVCLTLLESTNPLVLTLAAASFSGALFHTLNHSVFKSLLFLNAGSVLQATGTQDLNKLGGLMRFMPVTAITALVASFAIAGVPLSSGFASKWGIYLGAVQGSAGARLLPVCAVAAMITSALTLAMMIKFFGSIFLTRTSELVNQQSSRRSNLEVGWKMKLSQIALAGLCLVLGLVPALGFGLVFRALNASRQGLGEVLANAIPVSASAWTGLGGLQSSAVYVPLVLLAVMGLLFALARLATRLGGAQRRVAAPWLCGYATATEMNRYRSRHFYAELKRYLGWAGGEPTPAKKKAPKPAETAKEESLAWSLEKN